MANNLFDNSLISSNQFLWKEPKTGIEIWMKREDKLHPFVSGNKFRKLKYNLQEAKKNGFHTILTFGGAFSNHIAATAAAAKLIGLKSVGIIRGEELGLDLPITLQQNATLKFANSQEMKLHFVSRSDYREKETQTFQQKLKEKFDDFYLIPEGGTNDLAIKGCEEILTKSDKENFDIICCSVGTGGTISGLINATLPSQKVLGFAALKGDFLRTEIDNYVKKNNWKLILDYHFGGYAKIDKSLIEFINSFKKAYKIQLDPIYTGKMMYGLFELLKYGQFKENTRILAIHTGGLQGIAGMNERLIRKQLPVIE